MEEYLSIKIKRPDNNLYEYKCNFGGYTTNIKYAFIFPPNSPEMQGAYFAIRWLHPDWDVKIVDVRYEIGTYISTIEKFQLFNKILSIIGNILISPILIPVVAFLIIKDKIIELYDKKKNISTNNKPMSILPL